MFKHAMQAAVGCLLACGAMAAEAPMEWTTEQDHQDMQRQLGITELRPGRSSNENAANAANYDEALANPYPDYPPLLIRGNGRKVQDARQWWQQRRPEIVELFEREVFGRVPRQVPQVEWSVTGSEVTKIGPRTVVARRLAGKVDNSAYPAIDVNLDLVLVTPQESSGPVPVMILFGRGRLPTEPAPVFPGRPADAVPPASTRVADPPATEQLIDAGWGYAYLNPTSVQPDNGAGLTRGIIGLVNKGQPRKPEDWGALRAWAWGASRVLDYLETQPNVDARRVGIEGVSRYGKAALVTMAFDQRFAVVLIGSSGEGGVKPHRRNFGEAVENLTSTGGYHWMAGNFLKYGAARASFGSRNAGDLPVDSHQLLALCAPRPTFISYGVPEQGDALWLDQQGSFMAAIAAQPVFRLLGVKDMGRSDDYTKELKPAINEGLLDGRLAWRQHDGGHTDAPNWRYFLPWAMRELGLLGSSR